MSDRIIISNYINIIIFTYFFNDRSDPKVLIYNFKSIIVTYKMITKFEYVYTYMYPYNLKYSICRLQKKQIYTLLISPTIISSKHYSRFINTDNSLIKQTIFLLLLLY